MYLECQNGEQVLVNPNASTLSDGVVAAAQWAETVGQAVAVYAGGYEDVAGVYTGGRLVASVDGLDGGEVMLVYHDQTDAVEPLCGVKVQASLDVLVTFADFARLVNEGSISHLDAMRAHWRRVTCDWCIREQKRRIRAIMDKALDELEAVSEAERLDPGTRD